MDYRFRMSQEDLKYLYDTGKARVDAHPDIAEKHQKVIDQCANFKTEKEALEAVIKKENADRCQIWAKIELKDGIYRITDFWIATDDVATKIAADYIGMALMYSETRLFNIINSGVDLDQVVAYY